MTSPSGSDRPSWLTEVEGLVDETIGEARSEAAHQAATARKNRRWHDLIRGTLAVLVPVVPTAVATEGSRIDWASPHGIALVLTLLVGSLAALSTAFRWGDGFARARLAQRELENAAGSARVGRRKIAIVAGSNEGEAYRQLWELDGVLRSEIQRVISGAVQAEVAVAQQQQKLLDDLGKTKIAPNDGDDRRPPAGP